MATVTEAMSWPFSRLRYTRDPVIKWWWRTYPGAITGPVAEQTR